MANFVMSGVFACSFGTDIRATHVYLVAPVARIIFYNNFVFLFVLLCNSPSSEMPKIKVFHPRLYRPYFDLGLLLFTFCIDITDGGFCDDSHEKIHEQPPLE